MSALAASRVWSRRGKIAPIQAVRAAIEAILESAIVLSVAREWFALALTFALLRAIEELTLGSVTDRVTTCALLDLERGEPVTEAMRIGLRRVGLPTALIVLPAALVAIFAARGAVTAVLLATAIAIASGIAALWLHLRAGAAYATYDPDDRAATWTRAAETPKGPAIVGGCISLGLLWLASASAALLFPHEDVLKILAIAAASVATRPFMLALWSIRSWGPAPRR